MAQNQAAPKMPPLVPGEFRFITNALTADTEAPAGGPRRFRAVASSTVTDLTGNTISLKALNQLRDDFRNGLTIFMDHDYTNVVDKVFGTSDTAEVVETTARDDRTGAPIYDLVIAGPVNEPNPKAVQLHDSIAGGYVKFGTSIGAIVRKHTRDKETGGMLIDSISGKEASIVGIPRNQRSWAYKASAAVADMPDEDLADDPEEEHEEQVVAASGEVLQQWVVTPTTTTTTDGTSTTITVSSGTTGTPPSADDNVSDNLLRTETPAPKEPAPIEDAAEDETTPGGQEADAATPETAPATEDVADPAIEQQADIEVEDVAQLVKHVASLVEEIGKLRIQNAELTGEIESVKGEQARLAGVEFEAAEAIRKVMELPLRRKAVGHVEALVNRYPQFDPRVTAYIERTIKEKE